MFANPVRNSNVKMEKDFIRIVCVRLKYTILNPTIVVVLSFYISYLDQCCFLINNHIKRQNEFVTKQGTEEHLTYV